MQFIYQPLTWGFLLVLAPLVIHLITRMRHRPMQWAAMEFLLSSYRKNQRSVWLKQLLLLLLRMLLIATIVAMLAGLITLRQWSQLFGGRTTHHFVILDDSLSMSDRVAGVTVFDQARQALVQIASLANRDERAEKMTLIRLSQAARGQQRDAAGAATRADLNAMPMGADFSAQLEERAAAFVATQLALDPRPALELTEQLIDQATDEQRVLHLVSDFRAVEWDRPTAVREILARIERNGSRLRFVRCAAEKHANLAITELLPADGTRAAGVPLFVNVQVKNFSRALAEQVLVKVRTTFHPASLDGSESAPQAADLPDLLIERIPPGEMVSRQIQVFFPTAGQHLVEARLPADAIIADNVRACVIDLPLGESVTIVDGDPKGRGAYYLESIFQPGMTAKTGILPQIRPVQYLRDATPEELAGQRAIYLLDVGQLEPRARENLETYVRGGGGLAVFLGPNANLRFYNGWYAGGDGLFPAPISAAAELPAAGGEAAVPDLQFVDHPVFRALAGERNPFANSIRVQRSFPLPPLWKPPPNSTIQVLARLRNQQPVVIERQFGDGRVMAFLTTLTPTWNNWALEPSLIVVALQLHAFLASPQHATHERFVGSPLTLQLDSTEYRPNVRYLVPSSARETASIIERTAQPLQNNAALLTTTLGLDTAQGVATGETDLRGVYEAQLRTLEGTLRHRRFALNTNPVESDLSLLTRPELKERLAPLPVEVEDADDLLYQNTEQASQSWRYLLLILALGLLIGEQILAYSASYHPQPLARSGRAG